MATATASSDYFTRPLVTRLRGTASQRAGEPGSPHTPLQRSISSFYGSPGSDFSDAEQHVVLEFGSRFMRAGFAGEGTARCVLGFGPEEQRRVGDYRRWMPDYDDRPRTRKRGEKWGQSHELWRMDLRDLDIGLVEDKLERALRRSQYEYLLTDLKKRQYSLVVDSGLPRPLLSTVLTSIFNHQPASSVTIVPSSVATTVAAGLRSALVVDIGWRETTITAVYEYREVLSRQTVRASKKLSKEMSRTLAKEQERLQGTRIENGEVSLEDAEEVLARMGWCMDHEAAAQHASSSNSDAPAETVPIHISSSTEPLAVPFTSLAVPAETTLFPNPAHSDLDHHNQPLHTLAYNVLISLPVDVRRSCISRIILTGGSSNLLGLRRRLHEELSVMIAQRGWDPIKSYGSAKPRRSRASQRQSADVPTPLQPTPLQSPPNEIATNPSQPSLASPTIDIDDAATITSVSASSRSSTIIPPSARPQEPDPIYTKLHPAPRSPMPRSPISPTASNIPSEESGTVRIVNSLGPWAGASLISALHVKGMVEIERDRFMEFGMEAYGPRRKGEERARAKRQSAVAAVVDSKAGKSLGIWGLESPEV